MARPIDENHRISHRVFPVLHRITSAAPPAERLEKMTWQVDGETREALVYIPRDASTKPPIVFAFHGHGGNSQSAARGFAFHTHWPEAICVYPQGLPTKTAVDPQGKLPGWQKLAGDDADRDLHFFDAMLKTFTDGSQRRSRARSTAPVFPTARSSRTCCCHPATIRSPPSPPSPVCSARKRRTAPSPSRSSTSPARKIPS